LPIAAYAAVRDKNIRLDGLVADRRENKFLEIVFRVQSISGTAW